MLQNDGMIAVSIVSHGHGEMVSRLVAQLLDCPEVSKILVTKNIPEELLLPTTLKIKVVENLLPKGFGENHNCAFKEVHEEYFCPLNPDIRLLGNPFSGLIKTQKKYCAALTAPIVMNESGGIEDSIRNFPTPFSIGMKILFNLKERCNVVKDGDFFMPDWVAGMFMFFKSSAYKKVNGFDETFFLYYEDVDICARLWKEKMRILVDPSIYVIHDARRASRNNLFHMKLHIKSMGIYFLRYFMRLPKTQRHKKNV